MKVFPLKTTLALCFILLICCQSIHRVSANNKADSSSEEEKEQDKQKEQAKQEKQEEQEKPEEQQPQEEDEDEEDEENVKNITEIEDIAEEVDRDEEMKSQEAAPAYPGIAYADQEDELCAFDPYGKDEYTKMSECEPDTEPTHDRGDLGTAMGKCSVHRSMWRKICQGADAVNQHYNKITSATDPKAKVRAVEVQQITSIHEECMESQEGTMSAECKTCTVSLNPNKFGVILTCYECQRGASDRTCHHVIKTSPKMIVSSTFFEFVDLSAEENRNQSANRGFPR